MEGGQICLAIDDIAPLLDANEEHAVAQMLSRVLSSPSVCCCFAGLRRGPADLFLSLATARAHLRPPPAAGRGGEAAHGRLEVRTQRSTGRWNVEQHLFALRPAGAVSLWRMPEAPTAQQVVEAAVAKAKSSKEEANNLGKELMAKMDGGMKLTLSEQEREAKNKVVLPYEHRGDSSLYSTDDFTTYLPPAAGGTGAGSGKDKLGHILYVRDSDDELEYDSDEDPDDDLDI